MISLENGKAVVGMRRQQGLSLHGTRWWTLFWWARGCSLSIGHVDLPFISILLCTWLLADLSLLAVHTIQRG